MWDVTDNVILGSSGGRSAPQGQAVWEFDGSKWNLKTVEAKNGAVAGSPPVAPGRFKGHLRATPCVAPVTA